MSKDSVDNFLLTSTAMDMSIVLEPSMANEIQQLIAAAPCPVCGTNCSGCLEDLAARHEALRELLSHCLVMIDDAHGGAWDAYSDVADKLSKILGGEQ